MLFSVIIPTRNRPEYLGEAVSSVLTQTHQDLELLIVNDGAIAISPFDDPRVRVLNNAEAGAVPARNLGVGQACGEMIAFLDDDDVWTDRNFLKSATEVLAEGVDFVFGDGAMVYPDGRPSRPFAFDANSNSLAIDNTILISAVCYKRSLHQTLGLFDETLPYYWDWDWYLRVARAGYELRRIERPVVNIRIHQHNMSGTTNARERRNNLDLFSTIHALGNLELKSHLDFV